MEICPVTIDAVPTASPSGGLSLPTMSPEAIQKVRALQDALADCEQVDMPTEHLIHAGMYARTVRLGPGVALAGALLKVATTVIVSGDCTVFIGDEAVELSGYNVLAGGAGRKQAFVTHSEVCITAIFATDAASVCEAEAEATDEHESLQTRRVDAGALAFSGAQKCHMLP